MLCIYHADYSTTVLRRNDELWSQCVYLSTDIEALAMLLVDVSSFRIRDARWDVYRSPDKTLNCSSRVAGLRGQEAFMNIGPALRQQLGEQGGGLARELFAECTRGLMQAETFVYRERGYNSAKEYDDYWNETLKDSCRYFTNLDRVAQPWMDYIGEDVRDYSLYNRIKSTNVFRCDNCDLVINGNFIDSFHELTVNIVAESDGTIKESTANYLRAPDKVCFENSVHLGKLVGKKLTGLTKKDIAQDLGFSSGCTHLVDLVFDISQAHK
ncbi:MAG: DUF2889 domain-containing protein [Syntrophomonadaceae bacterium]|nr:DUF2889 domain-containing protein [Syntrophomonadaceae bacterium]